MTYPRQGVRRKIYFWQKNVRVLIPLQYTEIFEGATFVDIMPYQNGIKLVPIRGDL